MHKFSLLLLAIFFSLVACSPAKKLEIGAAMQAGDRILFQVTEETETEGTLPDGGGSFNSFETKITNYAYTVRGVRPDGSRDIEMRILRMQQIENDNGTVKEFDTANPDDSKENEAKRKLFALMLDHTFSFNLTTAGQLVEFKGMDELWARASEEFAEDKNFAMVITGIKTQFNNEAMSNQNAVYWGFYPNKAVRVGQKWKNKSSFQTFGLQQDSDYVLKERSATAASVNAKYRITTPNNKPGVMDFGVFKINYILNGAGAGRILCDQPSGLLKTMEQDITMSGTMEVKLAAMPTQKMPITIHVKSTTKRL